MQKQKIIAKWLAVVLLLTVAIACYVGLSSIIKKDGDNVAGANGTEQNQGDITTAKTFSEQGCPLVSRYLQVQDKSEEK